MLNRLYIIVGIVAILALAAAFIVPRFVQWGDYRDRMETIVETALGTEVAIEGDIAFTLLPAPKLIFHDVVVGPAEAPLLKVASVEADFNLMDFLRDRYVVTRLELRQPQIDVGIDTAGLLVMPLALGAEGDQANVSVSNATIVDGTIRLADQRSGDTATISGVDGEMRLQAMRGPFAFQGSGTLDGQRYTARISTAALDANGATKVSMFAQTFGNQTSIALDGEMLTGQAPRFMGTLTLRQAPVPKGEDAAVEGDLVLTGQVEALTDQILLSSVILLPDENRPGTRLTGSASVRLAAEREFTATLSGGVVALPPRDATQEEGPQPYEFVRLLGELPVPLIPPMRGTLSLDIAELNLRSFAIRTVLVDASSDGEGWDVQRFSGKLAGDTTLSGAGRLSVADGRPAFSGQFALGTERLDLLAATWRKPPEDNPLFNVPGTLSGEIELDDQHLTLANGLFTLDGQEHTLGLSMAFGGDRKLEVTAGFGTLGQAQSSALVALLPNLSQDQSFGMTFPQGHVSVTAEAAHVLGLDGTGLAGEATWTGATLTVDRLAATDLGGAKFDIKGVLDAESEALAVQGSGVVAVADASAPALTGLFTLLDTPEYLKAFLVKSLPADLHLALEPATPEGGQLLTATGAVGATDFGMSAQFSAGIGAALTSPVTLTIQMAAKDAAALSAQLGLSSDEVFPPGAPLRLKAVIDGVPKGELGVSIVAEGGGDSIAFDGMISGAAAGLPDGSGKLKVTLSEASALASIAQAGGIHLPGISGTAKVAFTGDRSVTLTEISGLSSKESFEGNLALNRDGAMGQVSGVLSFYGIQIGSLTPFLTGSSGALTLLGGVWPDGPIDIGTQPRQTRGTITILANALKAGETTLIANPGFDLVWDETNVRIRGLQGTMGGGTINVDASVCCSGQLAEKQVTARVALSDVSLDALLPPALANVVDGQLTASVQLTGTGESVTSALALSSGEGSYQLTDVSIANFNPRAFQAVAAIPNLVSLDAPTLTNAVTSALEQGPFTTPQIGGGFSIAGGTVRFNNVAADGDGASLFGNINVGLDDLALGGSFTLTPKGQVDTDGLISETTSSVAAVLGGTLMAPESTFDLGTMGDAIQVRAYELEVDRLEVLQAEDAERQRSAAEERNRLIAEGARLAAETAATEALAGLAAVVPDSVQGARDQAGASADAAYLAAQTPVVPEVVVPDVAPFDLELPGVLDLAPFNPNVAPGDSSVTFTQQ